jgi:hypothetical protein
MRKYVIGFLLLVSVAAAFAIHASQHVTLDNAAAEAGSVLWVADAKQSTLSDPEGILHEWGNIGAQEKSRVSRVSNLDAADGGSAAPGGRAYRFETRVGDNEFGERAEVRNGNNNGTPKFSEPQYVEGDTRGFAFQVYIPPSFPINQTGFDLIAQWHQAGGNASPPWAIYVGGGKLWVGIDTQQHDESGGTGATPFSVSVPTGRWLRFAFEAHFAVQTGWLDTYADLGDGQGMLKRGPREENIPTVKWTQGTTTVKPTFSDLGSYRGNYSFSGPQHFYATSYVIATDRATAEARAFGAPVEETKTETTETTPPPPPPTVPAAPTGLTATSSGGSSPAITIKWSAVLTATSYKLYRAGNENIEGRKPGQQWGESTTGLSFTNRLLVTSGGLYCYELAAVNTVGESPKSAPVCAVA